LGCERIPDSRVAATLVRRHDPAVLVHEDEMRLIVGAQPPGALAQWILDRRPGPAVAVDERPSLVDRVGYVDPEVRQLGVILLELCVGDRLALARASPGRPDVHEHGPAPEAGE
jgi:hypothetical protein